MSKTVADMEVSGNAASAAYRRVWEIEKLLTPRPMDFISTARFFVREGDMVVWEERGSKKVLRYFFLFNDILLICSQPRRKKYRLRVYITLRSPNVSVETVESSSFNAEMRIHCKRKSFICYVPNAEDKKYWVQFIRMSIDGTHPEENHTKEIHKKAAELIAPPEPKEYSESSSEEEVPVAAPVVVEEKKKKKPKSTPTSSSTASPTSSFDPNVFNTSNPFISTTAASPFASANPFATLTLSNNPTPSSTPPLLSPTSSSLANPFLTNTTPFGGSSTTGVFTPQPAAPASAAFSTTITAPTFTIPTFAPPAILSTPLYTPSPAPVFSPTVSAAPMFFPGPTAVSNPFMTNSATSNPFLQK